MSVVRKKRVYKVPVYGFGIDTVRFNFGSDFEATLFNSLKQGLSQNSPQKCEVSFMGYFFDVVSYSYRSRLSMQFLYQGDAVFVIDQILDTGIVKSISWVVTFYGAYFQIFALEGLLERFCEVFGYAATVSRVDLALDVGLSVDRLFALATTNTRKLCVWENAGRKETFYLGPKAYNPRHFIRVYDKKLDSRKKGKFHLYLDYLMKKEVTRIELQINSLSVRKFGIDSSHIVQCMKYGRNRRHAHLWKVFRRCCFNRFATCFRVKGIRSVPFVGKDMKKRPMKLLDELPYARRMMGYAKRLHEEGFDVVGYMEKYLDSCAKVKPPL